MLDPAFLTILAQCSNVPSPIRTRVATLKYHYWSWALKVSQKNPARNIDPMRFPGFRGLLDEFMTASVENMQVVLTTLPEVEAFYDCYLTEYLFREPVPTNMTEPEYRGIVLARLIREDRWDIIVGAIQGTLAPR